MVLGVKLRVYSLVLPQSPPPSPLPIAWLRGDFQSACAVFSPSITEWGGGADRRSDGVGMLSLRLNLTPKTTLGRPYNSGSRRGDPMWLPVFFNKLPVFFNKMPLRVPTMA